MKISQLLLRNLPASMCAVIVPITLLATTPLLSAADFVWQNGASNQNWNLNGSWVGGSFPPTASTDNDVFFDGNTLVNQTFLGVSRNVRSITFGSTLQSNTNATFDIQTATSLNTGTANLVFDAGVGNDATVTVENNASALAQIQLGRSGNGNVTLTSNLVINHNDADSAALLFDGVVTGAGTITKSGVGRIRLLRANSAWSGGININQGEVDFTNVPASSGTGTIRLGETASANNVILRFGGNGGAGNYANNIVVSSGAGDRTIQRFNSANGVGISTIVGTTSNTIDLSAGKSIVFDVQNFAANNDLITVNSSIFGSGGVVKSNTGRLVLAGTDNTYTGGTTINGGTVALSGALSALGDAANTLTMASGATLNLNSVTARVGNLNGAAGTITNTGTAATLIIGNGNATGGSYGGAISGSTTSLDKVGSGIQTLSGANTYTGSTTVTAGTLLINGSTAATSTVTVASGATLGGTGTIGGNTTINGNLAPGNSPGVLAFSQSLALNSTSTTTFEINGDSVRGTDYDGINVGTSLTYGGNLTLNFGNTFGVGDYTFYLFDLFSSQSGSFTTGGVTLDGSYTGTLVNDGFGVWGLTSGDNTWTFTQATGDLSLTVVPEPTTWMLLTGSLAALAAFRRRRS